MSILSRVTKLLGDLGNRSQACVSLHSLLLEQEGGTGVGTSDDWKSLTCRHRGLMPQTGEVTESWEAQSAGI